MKSSQTHSESLRILVELAVFLLHEVLLVIVNVYVHQDDEKLYVFLLLPPMRQKWYVRSVQYRNTGVNLSPMFPHPVHFNSRKSLESTLPRNNWVIKNVVRLFKDDSFCRRDSFDSFVHSSVWLDTTWHGQLTLWTSLSNSL
jgi:hypothetical protein